MIDWGLGHYESAAAQLEPAAAEVVAAADLHPGDRVLDIATGTGNAALIAARAGVAVSGVDAAERLLAVARLRAVEAGVDVDFRPGDLHSLPFDDDSFDVALSVFGIIFATDAEAAFGEMMRVVAPGGRAVFTVWVPAGPIDAMIGVFSRAIAAATGFTPTRFAWDQADVLRELAGASGAELRFHPRELQFVAESPEAFLEANDEHPMSFAGRPILERAGTAEQTREAALTVLREGNEDPSGFRVTSPYRLIEVERA